MKSERRIGNAIAHVYTQAYIQMTVFTTKTENLVNT